MDASAHDLGIYVFGPFRLDATRRTLLRDGVPVKLAARPFDTLLYFVSNPGRVIEKDALLSAIWGDRIVEEGNLTQTIFALRRALQAEGETDSTALIATIPGRGYRLAVDVRRDGAVAAPDRVAMAVAAPLLPAAPPPARPARPAGMWLGAALAATVVAALLTTGRRGAAPTAFTPPPHSIAVLPFRNMSGDAKRDYVSDGLSEELINTLSQVGQLRVVARTSAFSFRGSKAAVPEIARRLNVGAILEGSMRQDGGRLRITAQLIDAVSGYHLWSHDYDRPVGDVLHLQTDIAAEVTRALKISVLGEDEAKMALGGTNNAAAFDAYLRAIRLKHMMDPATARQALAACDEALALDPKFALAHVLRARVLTGIAEGFDNASNNVAAMREAGRAALREAELAATLAPDLATAHNAIGIAVQDDWDFRRAGSEFTRALQLAPNDPTALIDDSWLQAFLGHTQTAEAEANRAAALNPLAQGAFVDLVWNFIWSHKPDDAGVALRRAEDLGTSHLLATYLRGRIALSRGAWAQAHEICAAGEDYKQVYCLAIADHALGRQAEADADLSKLRTMMGDSAAFQYADIYAQWGRVDDALSALEHAYAVRDTGLMEIQVDPFLDPIRAQPRFKDVLRRMDFPP